MIAFLIIAVLYQILMWSLHQGFTLHWLTLGWIFGDTISAYVRGHIDPNSLLSDLIKFYKWVVSYCRRIKFR